MTPDRQQRVVEILEAALGLDGEARGEYIDRASGDDPSLRDEVWSLILHDERAGSFIEKPAADFRNRAIGDGRPEFSEGSRLGPYEIVRHLGEGGMGVVYLARHTRLDRLVALKLLPEQFTQDRDKVRRFEQEARAASRLQHDNIITIHDIAQTERVHYIVTEYVDGQTLREHLTREPMSPEQALSIVEQVASALKAAHEAGIVHRDVKPENIMIRRDGVVKVLDFGLAKLAEPVASDSRAQTLFHTRPGILIGTPNYMSPEQVAGEAVDARSDLFSLGAVLYECLSGRLAFSGASVLAVWRQIESHAPSPPSAINPQAPPEVDRVTLKLLAKNPDERYQSAEELLAELRTTADYAKLPARIVAEHPRKRVLPNLPSNFRLSRLPLILTGGTICITLAVLVAWLSWPHRPNPHALEKYTSGTRALRDSLNFKASKLLEDAVRSDPQFATAHAALAGAWMELDYSELSKEENINAQAAERRYPWLWRLLNRGDLLYIKAVDADVRRAYAEAIEHYRRIVELSPKGPHAHLDLGRAYERSEEVDKALESYRRATDLDPQYAAAYLRQGSLYGRKREFASAYAALDKAESLYDRLGDDEGVAEVRYQRGVILNAEDKLEPAREQLERVLGMTRANQHQLVRAMLQLSNVLCAQGLTAEAEQLASRAKTVAQDEGISNLLTQGLIDLGNTFVQRRQLKEAEGYLRQALSLAQKHKGRRNEARALLSLGSVALARGDLEAARAFVEQATPFYMQGGYRTETLQALTILGLTNSKRGDYDAALQAFQNQLRVAEQAGDSSQMAWAYHGMGEVLGSLEQYPRALDSFERNVRINESQKIDIYVGYGVANSAEVLWRLGRYEEAQAALTRANSIADMPDESYKQLLPIISLIKAKMLLSRRQLRESQSESKYSLQMAAKDDVVAQIEAKYVLGLAHALSGDAHAGRRSCEEAVKLAAGFGDTRLLSAARLALAEALVEGGDAQTSLSVALQVKELSERYGQNDSGWRASLVAARAVAASGDKLRARGYASQARAALSKLQQDFGPENYRSYLGRPDIQQYSRQLAELLEADT